MFAQGPMATGANRVDVRIETALLTAELKITGRLVDASNATLLAKVESEVDEVMCIYKPIAGERPLWDFSSGTLAYREYAAYLVSSMSDFNVVPFTVLREGPFGEGAVQFWIDIDQSIDMVEFFQRDSIELRKIALFDAIINNTDRKIGHLLPTEGGQVFGCDHGVTFHSEDKLRTVLWQWAGAEFNDEEVSLLRQVSDLLDASLGRELEALLSKEEIDALKMRVGRLTSSGKFPLPSKDWPSVPWPPF